MYVDVKRHLVELLRGFFQGVLQLFAVLEDLAGFQLSVKCVVDHGS